MRLRAHELYPVHKIDFLLWPRDSSETEIRSFGSPKDRRPSSLARISRTPVTCRNAEFMNRKVVEQGGTCPICHEDFTDYNDIVPNHKSPKGMGGAWRDDHPDNIQATHWWCNEEKGSSRM